MGRRTKPYFFKAENETIDGFYRYPKGNRWRINATGEEFRCNSELEAVATFRQWQASQKRAATVELRADSVKNREQITEEATAPVAEQHALRGGMLAGTDS